MTGPYLHWAYDEAGWTEPLEPFLADTNMTSPDYDEADIFEGLMAANRWDLTLGGGVGQGSQWAIPVMVETYVQSYRKDIYDELGIEPAETIEQWRENNAKATSGDVKGIIVRGEQEGRDDRYRVHLDGSRLRRPRLRRRVRLPDQFARSGPCRPVSTAPRCGSPVLRAGRT